MLHDFLTTHRAELIARCRRKVSVRPAPLATELELQFGVPVFLQELVLALELEEAHADIDPVSGPSNPIRTPSPSAIGRSAARHGRELQ